ncbi:MAG: hypothetical protein RJA70_664 [Pseudomonadota bacterium]
MSDPDKNKPPIELKVEYKRLNTFFADYTKNISRGSSFIATKNPLAIETEFVFVLGVPLLDEPLRLNGKVAWVTGVDEASKANPAGMGIEFLYADDAERQAIQDRVEDLMKEQLGPRLAKRLLG